MSAWTAINVEEEEDLAPDIDDTKEIQLEEAFKLYQNALRLHSLGEPHYEEAREAYEELFRSEVFKYPEAASAFDDDYADESLPTPTLPADVSAAPVVAIAATDNANSLPQFVYLAYKSRAQFEVDSAHALYRQSSGNDPSAVFEHYGQACKASLLDSAAALERDDTDLDLWKRASRVSDALQTVRIVRFCLESVLAGDDEGEDQIDLSGLEEAFAQGELNVVVSMVEDLLAASRVSNPQPRDALLNLLKQSNDPYPFLPAKPTTLQYVSDNKRPLFFSPTGIRIALPSTRYSAVTQALLQTVASSNGQASTAGSGTAIKIELPDMDEAPDLEMTQQPANLVMEEPLHPQKSTAASDGGGEDASPASFHSVPEGHRPKSPSPQSPVVDQHAPESTSRPQTDANSPQVLLTAPDSSVSLPSRKRSSTAAGNEEPEARTKSKRIKARESLVVTAAQEEEVSHDPSSMYREQLSSIEGADDLMFKSINNILEKIAVSGLGAIEQLRNNLSHEADEADGTSADNASASDQETVVVQDLKHALKTWNDERNAAFVSGHGGRDHVEKSTGLALFLKHAKANLAEGSVAPMTEHSAKVRDFVENVNAAGSSAQDALFVWLLELLTQAPSSTDLSPYLQGTWASELKQAVVEVLVVADEQISTCFWQWALGYQGMCSSPLWSPTCAIPPRRAIEFAQTLFELHLNIYSEVTNPASTVDNDTRRKQFERLQRWANYATDTVQNARDRDAGGTGHSEQLVLRFLWASVTFTKLSESVDKRHVLLCLNDLQQVLQLSETQELYLPNNVAIPIISASAVEQEISKVKTLEFFMSVFDSDNSDPEAVIMKLEPILEYDESSQASVLSEVAKEQIQNFRSFLNTGDVSLTMFLWKRLQNAYTAISYNTKVVSCLLRSVEAIMQEIFSMPAKGKHSMEREMSLLRWLRDADELVTKVLGKIADDKAAFEAIDEAHLRSSMSAVVSLIRISYGFVLSDDYLRVGFITPPSFRNATASRNFEKCRDRFREMHVRLLTLLYWMVKESTVQMTDSYDDATSDLVLFLRSVHAAIGERRYCKHCNKLFVRIAKMELFSFDTSEDLSLDIAQVVFDLYQVKLTTSYAEVDHGCSAEPLEKDKRTAQTLVPIIMNYVKRLNVKDVMRSELKATIDRIHNALGQPKASTALSFNRRAVSAYLKSVINPQKLYQSLRGIGELETKAVHSEAADIASHGWYLLLGNMTLAKYRSVKRVNPTPTDDLDNALAYLRQDIEHNPSNWQSWYRLAQVYDAKIEDNLIWNSNKLNEGRSELATLERNTINAYAMATALAMRSAEDDSVTTELLNGMLFEFATRLYSSSRPPLDMEAFSTKKAVRHLSDYYSQAMSEEPMFRPISEYNVWSFASHLLQRSLSSGSKLWSRFYMLGKCFWKMFRSPANEHVRRPVKVHDVIDAFMDAVSRVPKKERSTDPILEPHFKLVSIVHKLQKMRAIPAGEAVQYLQGTSYAKGVQMREDDRGRPDWQAYILSVLKKLKNADKSGWHHRITARAAHVVYDSDRSVGAALEAKHQFADSIFTKNMTMQVWKPENERAGRHYVYTGRYLRFFVEILDTLRDRSNLEQVVRKIRRKTTDFVNHTKVWEDAVTVYVDLLRRIGSIPRGRERALFDSISFDEFTRQSETLEKWAHEPGTTTQYLDIIKDAIEIKKLNNSLMKGSAIDDLIGDAYACMYELFVSQLPPEEQAAPINSAVQGTFINLTSNTARTGDDGLDRMRLNNLLTGQTDGASGSTSDNLPRTTGLGIITSSAQGLDTPPPDARAPVPAKPGRAKTITKREVQRKAEGAIGKPPPIKTPTLTKRSISVYIPSITKDNSEDNNDDLNDSFKGHANIVSGLSSRRGSVSMRNSPDSDAADDEGEDGDNEENEDDDNEASEAEIGNNVKVKKRLFSGLASAAQNDDDDDDDDEIEESDDDEKLSDRRDAQVEGGNGPEIPNSQEPAGLHPKREDEMDTD
ncbi:Histone transcription regulator 3 [Exophiala xenobiotica]|uniref:Histone transcription regulator 3 homolog n=1 Tax=Lithohypha guttulata TaxID=1690604 RepID=A0ABR0KJS5_9EURO|nr:Histone transcription regulator 3 [Lithohypha guttulata]KAK5325309.1 Histone transcription regulator 3 [Exophiala xenobiotica]